MIVVEYPARRGSSLQQRWVQSGSGQTAEMAVLGEGAGAARCHKQPPLLLLLLGLVVFLPAFLCSLKVAPLVEEMGDHKDVKKFFRTRNDVLVLYCRSAAAAESSLRLLSGVAQEV